LKVHLVALAFSVTAGGAIHAETNLLNNGGFEEGALEPWEWFVAGGAKATGEVDSEEKHGGEASYRIHNESPLEPNVYGQLRQYAHGLKANTAYILTAWVKGKDVSGGQIALGPGWKTLERLPEGTFDWTEVKKEFTTDDAPEKYDVVFLTGSNTGALWIDDVKIEEAGGEKSSLFEPSRWRGVPASASFYPVYAAGLPSEHLPVVSLRSSEEPYFGGNIQIAASRNSVFF
jgi:hypothetical protein